MQVNIHEAKSQLSRLMRQLRCSNNPEIAIPDLLKNIALHKTHQYQESAADQISARLYK